MISAGFFSNEDFMNRFHTRVFVYGSYNIEPHAQLAGGSTPLAGFAKFSMKVTGFSAVFADVRCDRH